MHIQNYKCYTLTTNVLGLDKKLNLQPFFTKEIMKEYTKISILTLMVLKTEFLFSPQENVLKLLLSHA